MHKYKWTAFKGTCWGKKKKSFMFVGLNTNAWLDTPPCKNLTFMYIGSTNSKICIYVSKRLDWSIKAQSLSFPHSAFPAYSTSVFYFFSFLLHSSKPLYLFFLLILVLYSAPLWLRNIMSNHPIAQM